MEIDFIRNRITELRLDKGVSELAMSKALGHSRTYITQITSGRINPSLQELLFIIDYLGVSPRTFFTEANTNHSLQLQKLVDRLEKYSDEDISAILSFIEHIDRKK